MSHRLPPLNGLRAFEASARHSSFKMAASELGVTPGAVSQQVKALEASLRVELFRRLPRGLLLTSSGEAYLPALSEAFRIISNATEDVAPALPSRKLRIGLSAGLKAVLPPKWPQGVQDLTRNVICTETTDDIELIQSGQLDGILRLRRAEGHGLSSEKIASFQGADHMEDIHYIASRGMAGCRQSRVLVSSLGEIFPSIEP